LSRNRGSLDVSQPFGPPPLLTGIALSFLCINIVPFLMVARRQGNVKGRNLTEDLGIGGMIIVKSTLK
jgi:hypothetical protein